MTHIFHPFRFSHVPRAPLMMFPRVRCLKSSLSRQIKCHGFGCVRLVKLLWSRYIHLLYEVIRSGSILYNLLAFRTILETFLEYPECESRAPRGKGFQERRACKALKGTCDLACSTDSECMAICSQQCRVARHLSTAIPHCELHRLERYHCRVTQRRRKHPHLSFRVLLLCCLCSVCLCIIRTYGLYFFACFAPRMCRGPSECFELLVHPECSIGQRGRN